MSLRLVLFSACMALAGGGALAQDASMVQVVEHTCVSPTGRFRVEQYHTAGGDHWDWEFWISGKGAGPAVKLSTGERDPAMYSASFFFHPTEQWLLRTQKTGSGDNVAVLYRINKDGTFVRADARNTFDERAWAEFDRAYSLSKDATQRYHTGCEFLGWEPDGETLRLQLTATHCGEDYRVNWTVHYHLNTQRFFFASDDRAHNKKLGLVWKKVHDHLTTPAPASPEHSGRKGAKDTTVVQGNNTQALDDVRLLIAGDIISVQMPGMSADKYRLTVMHDGFVEVPYIGKIKAAGRTCRQLAFAIRVEIEKQYFG